MVHPVMSSGLAENVDLQEISDDGEELCGVIEGQAVIWDVPQRKVIRKVKLNARNMRVVSLLNEGRGLLEGGVLIPPFARTFDSESWQRLPEGSTGVNGFSVSLKGGFIAASSYGRRSRVRKLV